MGPKDKKHNSWDVESGLGIGGTGSDDYNIHTDAIFPSKRRSPPPERAMPPPARPKASAHPARTAAAVEPKLTGIQAQASTYARIIGTNTKPEDTMDEQERKQAASIMGQSTSEAEAAAAGENGKLGGRPLTLKRLGETA